MSTSNGRYKSISIEFLKVDFGYSKMGRCVTFVVPKSEAERLGVKVGWLEENVERRAISNHTKLGRNKSESKTLTYIVHFLAPRRQIFYKVVWKALASTHCKMDHVQRKIVGSVELGIVLRVMDIVKNRALVACPKSGWNPDVSGWLPNQPFAWLSLRARDGTDILKNISESELYTSVGLSSLSRSSSKTTMWPQSYCPRKARMKLPGIYSTEHSRSAQSHYPERKSATHNKLRQSKQTTKLSHLTPTHAGSIGSCRPTTRDTFTTSSLKHSQEVFIDLKFKETNENSFTKNYIPLNFKIETALSHNVESQFMTSSISRKNLDSLTRSKTLSDSYVPEAQTKGQEARGREHPNSSEKRVSVSYCEGKLNSKNSISRSSKLRDEDILRKSVTKRKHCRSEDNLIVLIPGSKAEVERIESRVGLRSSTESKLTHSSLESKHTSRNNELSDQRCGISQKESTRKQKIKEIETFAKWLAQGIKTPMPSFKQAKDKTSSVRIGKHFIIENEKYQHLPSERLIKLLNVKKHRIKVYNRFVDSGIFPINNSEKPQASGKMNAPFRFNSELEVREKHGPGLLSSANV